MRVTPRVTRVTPRSDECDRVPAGSPNRVRLWKSPVFRCLSNKEVGCGVSQRWGIPPTHSLTFMEYTQNSWGLVPALGLLPRTRYLPEMQCGEQIWVLSAETAGDEGRHQSLRHQPCQFSFCKWSTSREAFSGRSHQGRTCLCPRNIWRR